MHYLRELLPRHMISHRSGIHWPARSPDFAPCEFFPWGYLKGEEYKRRSRNLVELKTAIREKNPADNTSYDRESAELEKTSQLLYQYPRTSYGECCTPQVNRINL